MMIMMDMFLMLDLDILELEEEILIIMEEIKYMLHS